MRILYILCLLTISTYGFAQEVLNGLVINSKEIPIANVKIQEVGTSNLCYSRSDGTFTLFRYSDEGSLMFSHNDYDSLVRFGDSSSIKVFLTLNGNEYNLGYLAAYTDFSTKNANKRLENMPYLLGEADVNRQLQMLPGVEHGNEGFSNLLIRGGNVDENLMLYNGTPVYNYNHLFGLSSLFHNNSIGDVKLHKGISSSKFGGRLSSVIEVETPKNSEFSGLSRELETSLLSAGLHIRNFNKGKDYFTFSARRSYIDLMYPIEFRQNELNAYLYDVQLNYGRFLKNGDLLEFSLMVSHDKYFEVARYEPDSVTVLRRDLDFNWGNILGSVKYNQKFNDQLKAEHSVHFSDFKSTLDVEYQILNLVGSGGIPTFVQEDKRGIREYIGQSNWEYNYENNTDIYFGSQLNIKTYRPIYTEVSSTNFDNEADSEDQFGVKRYQGSVEFTLYGEYARTFNKLEVIGGFRSTLYNYKELTGVYFEPRLNLHYKLDNNTILKMAYNRNHQFTKLINTGGTEGVYNFWVPATDRVRPQVADIVSLDIERKIGDDYAAVASVYYKDMRNIHVVNNFYEAIDAEVDWQDQIFLGSGTAYGVELMFQKHWGMVTGWVGYSYAKSDRLFPDLSVEPFSFAFDRRHMLKAYMNMKFNRYWDFGINALYGSGQLFSIPDGIFYDLEGNLQLEYSSFNNYQSQDYQRIDLSVSKVRRSSSMNQKWKFYLYNTLSRKNTLSLSPGFESGFTTFEVDRLYVSIVPGVSYLITF